MIFVFRRAAGALGRFNWLLLSGYSLASQSILASGGGGGEIKIRTQRFQSRPYSEPGPHLVLKTRISADRAPRRGTARQNRLSSGTKREVRAPGEVGMALSFSYVSALVWLMT